MKQGEVEKSDQVRCSSCGRIVPAYDTVSFGSVERGYRRLCTRCFNDEMASLHGLDSFQHPDFTPIRLTDCTGEVHEFHLRSRLFGPGVALDAFELRGGYQFQIIGEPNEDPLALLQRLVEKIRRALSTKYLRPGELGLQIADAIVQGRIEWDDGHDGPVPRLIIDGREVTWEEFGHLLMSFEGWQFQLKIFDKSEES